MKLNNSDIRGLIARKGFVYANGAGAMKGMIALIRPDNEKLEFVNSETIAWLQKLNDVVHLDPKTRLRGWYAGDRVQVFSPVNNYAIWGQFGRIIKVFTKKVNGKAKGMALVDVEGVQYEVNANETAVHEREGVVDLHNMTPAEREEVVMHMAGITQTNSEKRDYFVYCECQGECGINLPFSQWQELDTFRGKSTAYILSRSCENAAGLGDDRIIATTRALLLVK